MITISILNTVVSLAFILLTIGIICSTNQYAIDRTIRSYTLSAYPPSGEFRKMRKIEQKKSFFLSLFTLYVPAALIHHTYFANHKALNNIVVSVLDMSCASLLVFAAVVILVWILPRELLKKGSGWLALVICVLFMYPGFMLAYYTYFNK